MNLELIFEWSFVVIFLAALFYAAIVIGNEKSNFLQEAEFKKFQNIKLPIPKWWSLIGEEEHLLQFNRADTRYDWSAKYQYLESTKSIAELSVEKLQSEKIKMDPPPEVIIEENPNHVFRDKEFAKNVQEFIRIEGTGTQDEQERLYYDLVLFRLKEENFYYQMESKSSVLNGCVEGPFFEEALFYTKNVNETRELLD